MEWLARSIAERDITAILDRFFESSQEIPRIKRGMFREREQWDYKAGLPGLARTNDPAWADVAAHVLAFHNARGGILFFGIADDFSFRGTRDRLDAKRFNDKIRRYVGDKVWVDFSREFIQVDQRYLGVAIIPAHELTPLRAQGDAAPRDNGERLFHAGDLCIRVGDERRILSGKDADEYLRQNRLPSPDARYLVREQNYRILRPDWHQFLRREDLCKAVEDALYDDRTYVTSLTGIGGVGKTALACWAVIQAHKKDKFDYIISVSAKDRELTTGGIRAVTPNLTSFENLLSEILDVLGFPDADQESAKRREEAVRDLLSGENALLFVDNLETVDDRRIIRFLETLPKPVKAITTSRVTSVRRATFPVSVGPLRTVEAIRFLEQNASRRGLSNVLAASRTEKERLVVSCSRIPLAIQWLIGQSNDLGSALSTAEAMAGSGKCDEELLEFSFRRVHSSLTQAASTVLSALSLDDEPKLLEPIAIAVDLGLDQVEEALNSLMDCSLVEQVWDDRVNDYAYRMLALTRRFAYRELQGSGRENQMRQRLAAWYEARDVPEGQRAQVVAARSGANNSEVILVDAAIDFRRQGKVDEADKFFRQALARNPNSWRAHREYAELLRDQRHTGAALKHYQRAADCAPRKGPERALIYREFGMLLRKSGQPDAGRRAIEMFEIALRETPNDNVLRHALASTYFRQGSTKRAQSIFEGLSQSRDAETRARTYPLLLQCYEKHRDLVLAADLQRRMDTDEEAKRAEMKSKRTVNASTRPFQKRHRRRKPRR